jgi:hypothetical protein
VDQPEITFIVAYRCPRCHAALEARTAESHSWIRCPKCGRASLPPEHMRTPSLRPMPLGDDVLVIGPTTDYPGMLRGTASQPVSHPGGARRVALAVGILASLTMLMISFLEGNGLNVAIFGATTVLLFAVLGYTARRG